MAMPRPLAGSFNDPAGLTDFAEGCRVESQDDVSVNGTVLEVLEESIRLEIDCDDSVRIVDKEDVIRIGYECSSCGELRPIEYTAPVMADDDSAYDAKIECTACKNDVEGQKNIWRY